MAQKIRPDSLRLGIVKDWHTRWFGKRSFRKDLEEDFEIEESFRIGVKKDLDKKLRFYIKGNECVSKRI